MNQAALSAIIRARDFSAADLATWCTAPERLAVYRNNLRHTLIDALATRFPACHRLLGAESFAFHAAAYLEMRPPSSPVLLHYGDDFPSYLADQPQLMPWPFLADVARIDWARGVAYHAADASVLRVAPSDANEMTALLDRRFKVHPAASALMSDFPAADIWQASGSPEQLAQIVWGEQEIAITRAHFTVDVRTVPRGTCAALQHIRDGATLYEAVTEAISADDRPDPSALIVSFLQCDLLVDDKGN